RAGRGEVRGGVPRARPRPDRGIPEVAGGRVRRALRAHPSQLPGRPTRTDGAAPRRRRPRPRRAPPRRASPRSQPPLPAPAPHPAAHRVGPVGAAEAAMADNPPMPVLRIATRKSPLALWQTEHVAARLRETQPGLHIELVPMSTRGDQVLDRSLAAIGRKGLFLKELEVAMQRGEADCAVHSLKDVPMELEPGFALPAILARADHADAFVSNRYDGIDALPQGARVGTSPLRRQAQLRARRPDLELVDLRGNVNTRLAKLDAGDYDAIVLACAGLQRLRFDARIRARLDAPDLLPAPPQRALAIR